ncbi:hypothetical protein PGB90_005107 [Kerria lacca]
MKERSWNEFKEFGDDSTDNMDEQDGQKLFITLTLFSVIDQFVLDLQSLHKDKLEMWTETVKKIKYKKIPYRLLKLLEMVPIQQASEEFTHSAIGYGLIAAFKIIHF